MRSLGYHKIIPDQDQVVPMAKYQPVAGAQFWTCYRNAGQGRRRASRPNKWRGGTLWRVLRVVKRGAVVHSINPSDGTNTGHQGLMEYDDSRHWVFETWRP